MHSNVMESIEEYLPTKRQIEEAEVSRALDGNYVGALNRVYSATLMSKKDIVSFNEEQEIRFLSALRICFSCNLSLAKRAKNPFALLWYLSDARTVVVQYTRDDIVEVASNNHESMDGKPYEFSEEILRDIGQYYIFIQQLSGTGLLSLITRLTSYLERMNEPMIRSLMFFEVAELEVMYQDNPKSRALLLKAAENAIKISTENLNYERVATIAARLYVASVDQKVRDYAFSEFNKAEQQDWTVSKTLNRQVRRVKTEKWLIPLRRTIFFLMRVNWKNFEVSV